MRHSGRRYIPTKLDPLSFAQLLRAPFPRSPGGAVGTIAELDVRDGCDRQGGS